MTTKGLEKALKDKDIDFQIFANTTEEKRKKMLGEDYQEVKTEYGWIYDQPINNENMKLANATPTTAAATASTDQAAYDKQAEARAEEESKSYGSKKKSNW